MEEVSLVFPHQLYEKNAALAKNRDVLMIEDDLFFGQYNFHLQKLAYHRATMKYYEAELVSRGFKIIYCEHKGPKTLEQVFVLLKERGARRVFSVDPDDYLLERRLRRLCKQHEIQLELSDNPGFICSKEYIEKYFSGKQKYFLNNFYIDQRKRLGLLVENDQPVGGKWSFDTENRKKMPASVKLEEVVVPPSSPLKKQACDYVKQKFPRGYGKLDTILYPVTRNEALNSFESFLERRFKNYGVYQDAIVQRDSFLFHSVLTPALNVGLVTPHEILSRAVEFGITEKIPLNSLEGFVRQILGWREYMRALYHLEGVNQRTTNFFHHTNTMSKKFWTANTGIDPIDNVIEKVLDNAYANHIERLMVMGNFMLLCEIDPDDIYRWFMEMFIDAYDWVMVPNVYGMSQYAAGGLLSTKPYISSSNYILKMSDFKKGPWCEVWDALYWCFIEKHSELFLANPRMSMMVNILKKMDPEKIRSMRKVKARFLEQLF